MDRRIVKSLALISLAWAAPLATARADEPNDMPPPGVPLSQVIGSPMPASTAGMLPPRNVNGLDANKLPPYDQTPPPYDVKLMPGPAMGAHPVAAAPHEHHRHRRRLFGREHLCADCQRAKLAAQGVNVPPPPSMTVPGETLTMLSNAPCAACDAAKAGVVMMPSGSQPGHAVVGDMPGYAVVGDMPAGAEPEPIGRVQANWPNHHGAMAAGPGQPGQYDHGVMPSSYTGKAPRLTPMGDPPKRNPMILGHLFGLTEVGKSRRLERDKKARETHAAIAYDQQNQIVTEIPASAVYGKDKH